MVRIFIKTLLAIISLASVVLLAGVIKFNYLDVPYLGDTVTYKAETGEMIYVDKRVDDSIQLNLPNNPRNILQPVETEAGIKYQNESLSFLQTGTHFAVEKSGDILYVGKRHESGRQKN